MHKSHVIDLKKSASAGVGVGVAVCGVKQVRALAVVDRPIKFVEPRKATCKRCNPRRRK